MKGFRAELLIHKPKRKPMHGSYLILADNSLHARQLLAFEISQIALHDGERIEILTIKTSVLDAKHH